jgi:hypothetical protein
VELALAATSATNADREALARFGALGLTSTLLERSAALAEAAGLANGLIVAGGGVATVVVTVAGTVTYAVGTGRLSAAAAAAGGAPRCRSRSARMVTTLAASAANAADARGVIHPTAAPDGECVAAGLSDALVGGRLDAMRNGGGCTGGWLDRLNGSLSGKLVGPPDGRRRPIGVLAARMVASLIVGSRSQSSATMADPDCSAKVVSACRCTAME